MTDETPISQDAASEAPRTKRISNPRPKKQAKPAKTEVPQAEGVVETPAPQEPATVIETVEESSPSQNDWPEPEPASTGGPSAGGEGGKRKRRRKKNKGSKHQESQAHAESETDAEEGTPEGTQRPASAQGQGPRPQQPQQPPRPKLDSEAVAKLACKIYLAEVSEEGVALIGDGDAKELARRCFRLSEIFLEEQARRR